MTRAEFEAGVRALLDGVAAMTLATAANGDVWASDVYFAPDDYALLFFSAPAARHCRNLATNARCAATVHAPATSWRDIRGLQMEGEAVLLVDAEARARAFEIYVAKFPFARDLLAADGSVAGGSRVEAHAFRPARIRYIYNARGFGTRFVIRLQDGAPAGEPEPDRS